MLSPQTISTVKATAPVLVEHGEALTRHFYRRMFEGDPEVRAFFNSTNQHLGAQQRALAGAICAYAENIDNLDVLGPAVELIAQKHASLKIRPEHYPIVGKHLLGSIKEVLGDAATDDIICAWAEAYGFLADIFTGREGQIYEDHRETHGWEGFSPFVVHQVEVESDCITSFYLKPEDGRDLAPWQPGQYLTLRFPSADTGTTMRNYSLSNRPGEKRYRISVKRELGPVEKAMPGLISNHLHDHVRVGDTVEVGPPCGEFFLDLEQAAGVERPLIFLSGGVGITPVLSMFAAAQAAQLDRKIYFVHGALNGRMHALREEVESIAQRHGNVLLHFRYSDPTPADRDEGRCDSEGMIDVSFLESLLPAGLDGDYYICGPTPFMTSLENGLLQAGLSEERLHIEFFGPKAKTG